MPVSFYFPTKSGPTAQWTPTRQPVFPALEAVDYPEQLIGETAGGTLYVQDKGARRENFQLEFDRLPASDRDQAVTFFDTVKKSLRVFEYEDWKGNVHSVRWINGFNFEHVAEGRYSGVIELRKE